MRDRILEESVAAFAEVGYHGTSIRDIAQRVDCSVSTIYTWFDSKSDLLAALIFGTAEELTDEVQMALLGTSEDATSRLAAAVSAHVTFHAFRQKESFVAASEIRSLSPESKTLNIQQRDHYERIFVQILVDGVASGEFSTPYPDEVARALLAMCTAVATWYRADGPLSVTEVADRYVQLAMSMASTPSAVEVAGRFERLTP